MELLYLVLNDIYYKKYVLTIFLILALDADLIINKQS